MVTRARVRLAVGLAVPLAIVLAVGLLWWRSLVPSTYSVMDMGYLDYGGGPHGTTGQHDMAGMGDMPGMEGMAHGGTTSVADLHGPATGAADVTVHLEARRESFHLATGEEVDGFTLNGTSPGPAIEATEGDLVEVRLHNVDVSDGVALHWHGLDVPNGEDGVAGVTQDAVAPGEDHTYRFVADHAGTYWYHSHQVSHEQVERGLFGALVVRPARPAATPEARDVVVVSHDYGSGTTLNGRTGPLRVDARPGEQVRVRLINTDNGPQVVWSTTPLTLVASDGFDVHGPTAFTGRAVDVPAGGRADLVLTVPEGGARVQLLGDSSVVLGPGGEAPRGVEQPDRFLDRLHYGTPAPVPFRTDRPDRRFRYAIGRRLGFVDGRPGLQWSVNGHLFPDLPMFVVQEGDVVRVRISNTSGDIHPMHLHGHHAVVISRNGKRATGAPWWMDSLDVRDGETFDVVFLADNPGIWMDHCHNLKHAAQGLVTHLMYAGVTTPYRVGGKAGNSPE